MQTLITMIVDIEGGDINRMRYWLEREWLNIAAQIGKPPPKWLRNTEPERPYYQCLLFRSEDKTEGVIEIEERKQNAVHLNMTTTDLAMFWSFANALMVNYGPLHLFVLASSEFFPLKWYSNLSEVSTKLKPFRASTETYTALVLAGQLETHNAIDAPSLADTWPAGQIEPQRQRAAAVWANEDWHRELTIDERERYDRLRPYKERWEAGDVTTKELAEAFGVSEDTIRRWRRELARSGALDMDWKKH